MDGVVAGARMDTLKHLNVDESIDMLKNKNKNYVDTHHTTDYYKVHCFFAVDS